MPPKTDAEVDAIMRSVPEQWRERWCGGEAGPCACLGCVQIGNRYVMALATSGRPFLGDPEHINETLIPSGIFYQYKITKDEWLRWMSRVGSSRDAGIFKE